MKVNTGHLTYCTNIHAGKNWEEDFNALKLNFPIIKQAVSPNQPMGLGLRLSNQASLQLKNSNELAEFKTWLKDNQAYVFTMNGFPYGDFHHTVVKAEVHTPDWTTDERTAYTIRLFHILKSLLPEGMDGGISTSPLSYKYWHKTTEDLQETKRVATFNIIQVIIELVNIYEESGKVLHLDMEPEPDGIIETGREFIDWFENELLVMAIPELTEEFGISEKEAEGLVKRHLCLCYDVCHFAVGFEDHALVVKELDQKGINVGKIQISAALKADLAIGTAEREIIKSNFAKFDEPTYLHQVVAQNDDGSLERYPDLKQALDGFDTGKAKQWRSHFHVPISIKDVGALQSTQDDILTVLELQKTTPFTNHMEVETYTWEVLPVQLKLPIAQSIINELNWVVDTNI